DRPRHQRSADRPHHQPGAGRAHRIVGDRSPRRGRALRRGTHRAPGARLPPACGDDRPQPDQRLTAAPPRLSAVPRAPTSWDPLRPTRPGYSAAAQLCERATVKFAQASQTVVGMIPTRIRTLKTWQPRQRANTDSRVAATPMKATRINAGSSRLKPNQSTVAPTVKTAPIP